MSLCSILVNNIKKALSSGKDDKFLSISYVFNFIEKETKIKSSEKVNCMPIYIIELLLLSNGALQPLRDYQHPDKTIHREASVLIQLGFCYVTEDNIFLRIEKELYFALSLLTQREKMYQEQLAFQKKVRDFISK